VTGTPATRKLHPLQGERVIYLKNEFLSPTGRAVRREGAQLESQNRRPDPNSLVPLVRNFKKEVRKPNDKNGIEAERVD
jgi:hypothetical protein